MPKIEWAKDALDDLQKIDKPIVKRILKKISWLSRHFDDITPEPLSGELAGTFKLRVGDWRVIFQPSTLLTFNPSTIKLQNFDTIEGCRISEREQPSPYLLHF